MQWQSQFEDPANLVWKLRKSEAKEALAAFETSKREEEKDRQQSLPPAAMRSANEIGSAFRTNQSHVHPKQLRTCSTWHKLW